MNGVHMAKLELLPSYDHHLFLGPSLVDPVFTRICAPITLPHNERERELGGEKLKPEITAISRADALQQRLVVVGL